MHIFSNWIIVTNVQIIVADHPNLKRVSYCFSSKFKSGAFEWIYVQKMTLLAGDNGQSQGQWFLSVKFVNRSFVVSSEQKQKQKMNLMIVIPSKKCTQESGFTTAINSKTIFSIPIDNCQLRIFLSPLRCI